MTENRPLWIGLRAARANLVPSLCVQAVMVALVVAYYKVPAAQGGAEALGRVRGEWGLGFTFVSAILAGAVLPALCKAFMPGGAGFNRRAWEALAFYSAYWGIEGMIADCFYQYQAHLFGAHPDVATVLKKVLLDQFVFTPVFATPVALACFEFQNSGYSWKAGRAAFTWPFYRDRTVPALLAGWGFWFPATGAIYSLPSLLQIPLFALSLTIWALMLTYIAAHQHGAEKGQPAPAAGLASGRK